MDLIIYIITNLIQIYIYIIIFYVLLSYFPSLRESKLHQIFEGICEPFLQVFRFATISGISFAPALAIFTLMGIQYLIQIIYGYGG